MSVYVPESGTLRAVHDKSRNLWWVHDAYGPYDGPYESQLEANAAIAFMDPDGAYSLFDLDHMEPGES